MAGTKSRALSYQQMRQVEKILRRRIREKAELAESQEALAKIITEEVDFTCTLSNLRHMMRETEIPNAAVCSSVGKAKGGSNSKRVDELEKIVAQLLAWAEGQGFQLDVPTVDEEE